MQGLANLEPEAGIGTYEQYGQFAVGAAQAFPNITIIQTNLDGVLLSWKDKIKRNITLRELQIKNIKQYLSLEILQVTERH